jgi:hypothetical protein
MSWHPFHDGETIGTRGSEAGIILRDEEHDFGARITVERDGHSPFAITCGIYGWMVHTRFFSSEAEADDEYSRMKVDLDGILNLIPDTTDPELEAKEDAVVKAIKDFVERFP